MSVLEKLPVGRLLATDSKTKEKVVVLVDGDYDWEYFNQFKWIVGPGGFVKTCDRSLGTNGVWTYLHHMVLAPRKGYWRHHINGDRLDNRSCNVGYITPSESARRRNQKFVASYTNHWAKKRGGVSSSQYVGVSRQYHHYPNGTMRLTDRWTTKFRGKTVGHYDNEEEAGRAYDKAAYAYYKNVAVLNFPEGGKQ